MKVYYTAEVAKFVEELDLKDHTRLERTRQLFETYGFIIGQRYIKKISNSGIWELRAGNIRLFLCSRKEMALGVHIIRKKSQKLPLRDIKLAEKRCEQL